MSVPYQHLINIAPRFLSAVIIFFIVIIITSSFPLPNLSGSGYLLTSEVEGGTDVRLRAALDDAPTSASSGEQQTKRPVFAPSLAALSEACTTDELSDGTRHNSDADWVRPRAASVTSSTSAAGAFCYSFHRSHAPLTWSQAAFHCRALGADAAADPSPTGAAEAAVGGAELLWLSASDLAEAQWVVRAARAVANDFGNGSVRRPATASSTGAGEPLLLLLNAHRYIYNASGAAWASGELLAVGATTNKSRAPGEDLVCHSHAADNETADCFALELSAGRNYAFSCADVLQNTLVVCKRRARQTSRAASSTASPTAVSVAALPELPRPPHCVDTISSSTTDLSRFAGPGWTERRASPGLSAFYYQDPAARPATWVHAYHSCRSLRADLLWLEVRAHFLYVLYRIQLINTVEDKMLKTIHNAILLLV